jgi:peptidoglycan/xylan/chitin deacetylase (PgdA/CDA1 family)
MVAEAGFAAAVTTRKGLVFGEHRNHLTALPRLSLNGAYQDCDFADVLLTGAPFAMFNGLQRVVTS